MKTILHLERKFTAKTETFIVNQINTFQNYKIIVGTLIKTNELPCNKKIICPSKLSSLSQKARFLSSETKDDLLLKLKHHEISLIHCHYLVDAYFFLNLVKHFSIPKIVSCYGYDVSSFPKKYFGLSRLLIMQVFKKYDYFLAMSGDMKSDLINLGCDDKKIIIHYYGTDTKSFLNINKNYKSEDEVIKILTVGTLEEKKAQHLVLEALNLIVKKFNFVKFEYHIVGSGPYLEKLKNLADNLNLNGKVFFYGHIPHYSDELKKIYKQSDIFIHPSITTTDGDKEGIPGTIIEAMASGLPIVSTYHAGIPFVLENFREGLLCEEKDVEGLSDSIYKLFVNKDLRKLLGINAQSKAINYLDLQEGTNRLENIYSNILSKHNLN